MKELSSSMIQPVEVDPSPHKQHKDCVELEHVLDQSQES